MYIYDISETPSLTNLLRWNYFQDVRIKGDDDLRVIYGRDTSTVPPCEAHQIEEVIIGFATPGHLILGRPLQTPIRTIEPTADVAVRVLNAMRDIPESGLRFADEWEERVRKLLPRH